MIKWIDPVHRLEDWKFLGGYWTFVYSSFPASDRAGLVPVIKPAVWAPLAMVGQALPYTPNVESSRIVRQLLLESLMLAALSEALGLGLTVAAIDAMAMLQPRLEAPFRTVASVGARVLGFTVVLGMFAGLLFGLAPALQILRSGQSQEFRTTLWGNARYWNQVVFMVCFAG